MPGFFLSFCAVLLLAAGGREQHLVAALSQRMAKPVPLLAMALIASLLTASAATASGALLSDWLSPNGAQMFLAATLALAGVELLIERAGDSPTEPTRSLAAILLVLVWRQAGDAARFVIVGLAASQGNPWTVGAGATGASLVGAAFAWSMSGDFAKALPWRKLRAGLGVVLLILAALLAMSARGALG